MRQVRFFCKVQSLRKDSFPALVPGRILAGLRSLGGLVALAALVALLAEVGQRHAGAAAVQSTLEE